MLSSEIGTMVSTSVTLSKGVAVVPVGVTVTVTVSVTRVGGGSKDVEEISLIVEVGGNDRGLVKTGVLVRVLLMGTKVSLLDIVVVVVLLMVVEPVPVGPTIKVVLKAGKGGRTVVVGRLAEVVPVVVELRKTNPGPGIGVVSSCP